MKRTKYEYDDVVQKFRDFCGDPELFFGAKVKGCLFLCSSVLFILAGICCAPLRRLDRLVDTRAEERSPQAEMCVIFGQYLY